MPKNKKEDSDEEEYEKEELSSLEKRRLRVIKREENIKKRKLNDQTNVKRKKLKFIESSEEEFDYSQETESDSECSTIPSDEEDVKEMIFYFHLLCVQIH